MFGLFGSKKKAHRPRILVVDDEPDYVSTICCRLEWHHYEVITAINGKEGLEKAINEHPDLILLDTCMPVMDGHEMLERLRQHPDLKDTPVIMVTALCETQHIDIVSSYGVSDYVAKPFNATELIGKIANILEGKALNSEKK